jgi:hypothetical protein
MDPSGAQPKLAEPFFESVRADFAAEQGFHPAPEALHTWSDMSTDPTT